VTMSGQDKQFSGRKVLITGGGTGAGADLAISFANAGADVFIAGRRLAALEDIATRHAGIRAIQADVASENSVANMFSCSGACDIVIANAGIAASAPFHKLSLADWNSMMDINLTGVFLTLREGFKQMNDWGRLLVISSIAGLKGYPYVTHYCASKHGVIGLVRALAFEVARKPITVNAICPGYLDTPMTGRSAQNIVEKTGRPVDNAIQALTAGNPQRRLISTAEISTAAMWLCAPGSESVNGQAIAITGGE